MTTPVGVIGLGIMGGAIAANLLKSGFHVVGCDIAENCRDALVSVGGKAVATAREVVVECDICITSLPSVKALRQVIQGEDGIIVAAKDGVIVAECSTLPLDAKEEAFQALAQADVTLLDCPISGTGAQAATGDLSVFASGDQSAVERTAPVFEGFSRSHHYLGAFGNGSKMKFVANLLVHIHNVAAAEALVLGMRAGLDPQLIYDVIPSGAGTSRMFEIRGPMMVNSDYSQATMKIDMWQKDMDIIEAFANSLGCPTPLFDASRPLYDTALAEGYAKEDTASVCAVLEEMAGIKR
jgi:putative dehydrogenase